MKSLVLLVFLFTFLANPIAGGKLWPGFNNPEKWMKRAIRKLQRKSAAYGIKIASNTDGVSSNDQFISSMADCDSGYINDPDYGMSCCFEDTNNVGQCLCNGMTIDDLTDPGSCCFVNVEHPDNCLCSGTDIDDPNNPGNCCFEDTNNLEQCLCRAANYTDNPNKRCFNLDWKGDGCCDDENNHGGCDFDGGDCCGEDVDTDLCTLCQCLEEEAPLPNAVGCCFEDSNNLGQCLCTGNDIDDPDNAGSCCVEDPDHPGTCCDDSITCNDQGTCSSDSSGMCTCDSGFTGDRCNITTCPGTPVCGGNGNCPEGGTVCECEAGSYGADCADVRCFPPDCTTLVVWGGDIRDSHTDKDAIYINMENIDSISSCTVPAFSNPYADKTSHSGGLLENGKMVMCYDAPCYGVSPGSDGNPEVIVSMDRQRKEAASLELSDGRLWINGGSCSSCSDDQTYTGGTQSGSVYLTSSGATTGPTLPVAAQSHCTEYMDETHIILFGGDHYNLDKSGATDRQKTYIFDTVTETWSDGPRQPDFSYVTGNYHNMCSSLKNGLVFGGRSGVDSRFTLTPAGTWVEGNTKWPWVYHVAKIAYSEDTVLSVGGTANSKIHKYVCHVQGGCIKTEILNMGRLLGGPLLAWVKNSTVPASCA